MSEAYDILVSADECFFIVNILPAQAKFQMPDATMAGGMAFRLKVLALLRHMQLARLGPAALRPLTLTVGELWLLDTLMNTLDLRQTVAQGGVPVQQLAERVWDALIDAHLTEVDPRYVPSDTVQKIAAPDVVEKQREFLAGLDRYMEGTE